MSHERAAFVIGFRAIARAGVVSCLLLAAIALSVGVSEYPGYTRPALRWHTTEVLPLVVVGLINLAALDPWARRRRWPGLLTVAVDLALLVHALRTVRVGAPPFAFMLAGVAALLLAGALGLALRQLPPNLESP